MVVNHIPVDLYLRGVVPLEMPSSWPAEALKAQAIAARSYALTRVHPTTGLFDLYDDTRSQVYRGKRAETAATNLAISATAGTVLLSGTPIVNALYHSADGGWTENNENVFVGSTGEHRRRPGPVPAGVERPGARRDLLRRGLAVRDLEHGDVLVGGPVGDPREGPADERRDRSRPRPVAAGRLGPADQRDADRQPGHEDGVGRRLPRGVQCRPGRSPTRCFAGRSSRPPRSPDPVARYRRAMPDWSFDPALPRCWWAGDTGERPDPAMVRYHDEEWGTPCHDDTELFERLALESFQAGLSWSTILHKRDAFRTRLSRLRSGAVAAFDDADRERLMADAGIVRNRAKIDATIGNAAAWLAPRREYGSVDAYLATMVPDPPRRLGRRRRRRDPGANTRSRMRCRRTSAGAASTSSAPRSSTR